MKTQKKTNWLKKLAAAVAGIGASTIISYPVRAQFQYASSIFSPPPSSYISRSVDGTIAGELDAAIKYYQELSSFAEAMAQTGLTETLRVKEASDRHSIQFTVFAPTDEAFANLPAELRAQLLNPENQDLLVEVLEYHIVEGEVTSADIQAGVIQTTAFHPLKIEMNDAGDRITLNDTIEIVSSRRAENGVIVRIDRVLLPPNL